MVSVRVKVFGPLRDIIAGGEVQLDVPEHHTAGGVFDLLAQRNPQLSAWKSSLRLAVNMEYAPLDRVLKSGDEVSFIPPVSGG